jgi:hypothetical protein
MYLVMLEGQKMVWGIDDMHDYLAQYGTVTMYEQYPRMRSYVSTNWHDKPALHLKRKEDDWELWARPGNSSGEGDHWSFALYFAGVYMELIEWDVVRALKVFDEYEKTATRKIINELSPKEFWDGMTQKIKDNRYRMKQQQQQQEEPDTYII